MTDNMKKFLDYAETHGDTAKAVKALNAEATETEAKAKLIALAAEAGFTLTDADFEGKKLPEGELSDDEVENATGGGWGASDIHYASGDTPKFSVGQHVYASTSLYRYYGHITSVSSTKSGAINKEFTYSVLWDMRNFYFFGGETWENYDTTETGVFESELSTTPEW